MIITHNGTILKHDGTILTKITEVPPQPPFTNTYSLDFDGVDDYVDLGDSDDFSFGNGTTDSPFSISAWIKMDDASAFRVATKYENANREYLFTTDSSDRLSLALYDNSNGTRIQRKYNTALTSFQGQWINVVGTYDGSSLSSGINIYLNGTRVDDIDGNLGTYIAMENTTQPLEIGRSNLTSFSNGKIDEVAIFNTALTPTEITSIASAPTDLTNLSPVAWYRMGDNGAYKSPQWLLPSNENKDKVSNYSFEFDGVDDYINCGSLSNLQNATEYSISSWFKTPLNNQYQVIYSWFDGADGHLQLVSINDGSFIVYNYRTAQAYGLSATGLVSADTWYNALVVFDGGGATNADRLKLYLNGSLINLTYTGTIPTQTGTMLQNRFHLGAYVTILGAYTWTLEGNIDEVSIFNSAISIGDVWDGSGQPIDVSAVSGLTQNYRMGEEANFTSNWLVDNSALTNYSKRSFEFDGIDDYISVTPNPLTDFTVSFWIKPSSGVGASFDGILGQGTTSPQGGILRYVAYDGTASVGNVLVRLASWTNVSGSITNGVWTNVVLTYDSVADELKGYNNGSLYTTISSPDFSAQTTNAHSFERIGLRNGLSGSEFNGGIDEVAVWDSALTDISSIYNGGTPTTISGAVAHWRIGEDASFNGTNWTIPDNIGTNNGTSNAMTVDSLVGEAPNYSGGGISNAMTIEDRVGDAPNSENNALSYNMDEVDRVEDTPTP